MVRYDDAAKLRDAGAGLVGWWSGVEEPTSEDAEVDLYGCVMRVYPSHGRFVGHMYTARDLARLQARIYAHRCAQARLVGH